MKIPPHRRERYLRDPLAIQLGGIAANLARIASFGQDPSSGPVVDSLLYESKFFFEWAAPGAPIESAARLVELQVALAGWQIRWSTSSPDLVERTSLILFAREWSDRILEMSGLLADTSDDAAA